MDIQAEILQVQLPQFLVTIQYFPNMLQQLLHSQPLHFSNKRHTILTLKTQTLKIKL